MTEPILDSKSKKIIIICFRIKKICIIHKKGVPLHSQTGIFPQSEVGSVAQLDRATAF